MMKSLVLTGNMFSSDGSIHKVELRGPPSLENWLARWEVFQTTCIYLNALDLGVLVAYADKLKRYGSRYGPQTWALLYQADVRSRLEHWTVVMQELSELHSAALHAGGTTTFDPTRPWNAALSKLTADSDWWEMEFQEPALLMLNRIKEVGQLVTGDAPIIGQAPSNFAGSVYVETRSQQQAGLGSHRGGPPPMAAIVDAPRGQKRQHNDDGASNGCNVKDGRYVTSRKGLPLCPAFQAGTCGAHSQGRCPTDRTMMHQCNRCLSDQHGGDSGSCSKSPPTGGGSHPSGGHGKGGNKHGQQKQGKGGNGKAKGGKGGKGKWSQGWY